MTYYCYVYYDPRTMIPFYVGKGKGSRDRYHLSLRILQILRLSNTTSNGVIEKSASLSFFKICNKALLASAFVEKYISAIALLSRKCLSLYNVTLRATCFANILECQRLLDMLGFYNIPR